MWFKKVLFGLLALLLGLMGLAFGALFLLCLSIYLLWYGLNASIIVFGGLGPACVILARVALRRAAAKDKPGLSVSDPVPLPERRSNPLSLSSSERPRDGLRRRKML
jgi:hypothetical protein